MPFPAFIRAFPALDVPFAEDVVETRAIQSDRGLVVFFDFKQDFELPPHSHLGQWGTLVAGEIELTIDDETKTYTPGMSWDIPSNVVHSSKIKAGALVIDVFEEADRYALKD